MARSKEVVEETHYRLLILGDGSVRTVPLNGDRWTIGRALDCSVTLRDPTVSRRHLLLERRGGRFRVQDLGGANPAMLDGKPITTAEILPGQQLAIGLTRLVLEERRRTAPTAASENGTIVLSREVIDEEISDGLLTEEAGVPTTAAGVLQSIEWTFADLGDLSDAAEPLLELAMTLTGRRSGWLCRLLNDGAVETLAARAANGDTPRAPELSETALDDARRIRTPHLLRTREGAAERERLIVPLGEDAGGLLVLEEDEPDAPSGQELLRLAQSLGKVVWHRLQETTERARLREELERLRFHGTDAHNALLTSTRLQATRERLRACAADEAGVLLIGEPGTERENLARYLHAESARRTRPFVAFRARTAPDHRAAAELLGDARHPGALQRADSGTLFVDDADALPVEVQRALAAKMAEARGDEPAPRLVLSCEPCDDAEHSSCAPELRAFVDRSVIEIPPLRDDARDILTLAELFLSELGDCPNGSPRLLSERAKRLLTAHDWPGNVRELRLTLESAAASAGNQPIAPRHLPPELTRIADRDNPPLPTLEDIERQHIQEVMTCTGGVRTRAAQILGIATSTLYEKLKKYEIDG